MKPFFSPLGSILFILLFSFMLLPTRVVSQTKGKIEIGVGLYSFNKFPFKEAVQMSKKANVRNVEGFSFHQLGGEFGKSLFVDLTDSELAKMKEILKTNNIQMQSMYVDAKTTSDWEKVFKQADKLGLKYLVGEPDPQLLEVVNNLAKKYDLPFGIHEHAKGLSHYWHPDSVLTAINGRSHLKACADIGHWVRSGLDPVECLRKLEGNILSLHVKDLDSAGNPDAKDVNAGAGVIDFDAVVSELKRQGFVGDVLIECEHNWDNNLKDVIESVNYMNQKIKL